MSFAIVTDTSANLPTPWAEEKNVIVAPFSYLIDGEEFVCLDTREFKCGEYYQSLREGLKITTSQINPQRYMDYMEPVLKGGQDILYIGLSSGVSGSFASAQIAREQLLENYPQRNIRLVDSLGASLGEGLLVIKAARLREEGTNLDETADFLLKRRRHIYQVFTVDDLMYLRRGGRLSNAAAAIGTILGIKPVLKGNEAGKIVAFGKIRGRKGVIAALAGHYERLAAETEAQIIGISHGDCLEDAEKLAALLAQSSRPPAEIMIVEHEPVTGSYLGPGALALYFEGGGNVREK
ncbi:MAG: DegV family protein [Christensenellaceae bacterium]|nr:DegV family protein [Christensenellaceae bacterium]